MRNALVIGFVLGFAPALRAGSQIYFFDADGPGNPQWRIGRINADGTNIEELVVWPLLTSPIHQLTVYGDHIYWSDGTDIFRCGLEIPAGETAATRSDVVALEFAIPRQSGRTGLSINRQLGKLYYFDNRRLIRANLDGSSAEIVAGPDLATSAGEAWFVLDSTAPALGAWGLLALALLLVSAASVIAVRRSGNRVQGSLIVAFAFLFAGEVKAERFIQIDAGFVTGPASGTFYIGVAPVGSNAVQPLFTLPFQSGDTNSDLGRVLRNRALPEAGIAGLARRATVDSSAAIQVFHSDSTQFWGSIDGTNWQIIEHGDRDGQYWLHLQIGASPGPYSYVRLAEHGSNAFSAFGNVPAVGAWGMTALALGVLAAGSIMILKSRKLVGEMG